MRIQLLFEKNQPQILKKKNKDNEMFMEYIQKMKNKHETWTLYQQIVISNALIKDCHSSNRNDLLGILNQILPELFLLLIAVYNRHPQHAVIECFHPNIFLFLCGST